METNSPNGSGKGTWRERLGIGSKELPKIAGEFAAKPAEPRMAPRPPISRGSQAIAKPAPMAPRPAPGTRSPVTGGRPAITPQTSPESLAERLRAQRAAAERLAEQRVAAAKDRVAPAVNGSGRHGPEPKVAERPKFSFADDQQPPASAAPPPAPSATQVNSPPPAAPPLKRELPPPPRVSGSPIVPPRPALGGDLPRPDAVRGKPNTPPYQPQFNPPPAPAGYRPLDPPGYQYQPRPPTRPYAPPPYGGGAPANEPRLAPPPARGGYRRPAEDDEVYDDAPRRARGANRGRANVAEDDLDEVFEDDAPPKARRRASAQDYGRAYREYEDEFGDTERRRSRGPFMVLAGLVALAALIGGGIWYYNNFYKARGTAAIPGDVPVVTAPADPAKVDPPVPEASQTANDATPAAKAKLFYDRILGEQAIEGGQMTPTEEVPIAPAPSPSGSAAPLPDPANAATMPAGDPAPEVGDPATEALPLPLPPPAGSDTQGALPSPKTNASQTNVVPAAAPSAEEALAPVPGEATPPQLPATTAAAEPPPRIETIDAPASDTTATVDEIKPVVKKKVKKAEAKKRPKKADDTVAANGADPIVLVPPGEAAAADPSLATPDANQPVVPVENAQSGSFFGNTGKAKLRTSGKADDAISPQAQNVRKNFKSGTLAAAPADAAAEPQQVASIAEDAPVADPAPAPSATGSTGRYVVQLGSFRTQDEARAEANRLRSRSAALNGVDTTVVRASVFGSSRYRVMTTPVADRAAGDRICEALLSANEPNCSVKQQ